MHADGHQLIAAHARPNRADGSSELGMSWTTDRATALAFMERHSAAVTWQAYAGPESVLARFAAENEVVVQPDLLIDLVRIAELPQTGLGVVEAPSGPALAGPADWDTERGPGRDVPACGSGPR